MVMDTVMITTMVRDTECQIEFEVRKQYSALYQLCKSDFLEISYIKVDRRNYT